MMSEDELARLNQQIKDIHKAIGTLLAHLVSSPSRPIRPEDLLDVIRILKGDHARSTSQSSLGEDFKRLYERLSTLGEEIRTLGDELRKLRYERGHTQ
jgi:uncharacterized protein (UPF0335 family)